MPLIRACAIIFTNTISFSTRISSANLSLRQNHHNVAVLTIDQCQGQEADAIILSLVRRPTRFLTLNRLNVALSRVRKIMYVLTDFKDLQEACRDKNWESSGLATDLLTDFT